MDSPGLCNGRPPGDVRSAQAPPAEGSDPSDIHRVNRLLAALRPEDLGLLHPDLTVVRLRHGESIYEPGQLIEWAYFPHDSMISLVAVLDDGATAEVATFGRDGVAGLISSLVAEDAFGRYVVQVTGTASRISSARLQEAVAAHPSMQDVFSRYSRAILSQAFQTVACNALHSVEARSCRWILATRDRVGRDDLPLTHDFLSEMLGVQRPTVSLITRHLQATGALKQGRGRIEILDRAQLEAGACCCYRINRRNFERLLPGIFDPE